MKLRKYFTKTVATTMDIIDKSYYIDSLITIFNDMSGHKVRIVGYKGLDEDALVDVVDLVNKIRPSSIDPSVSQAIVARCDVVTKKSVGIANYIKLLETSLSADDTSHEVLDILFELVPSKFFVEDEVRQMEINNATYLKYLGDYEGYTIVDEIEDVSGIVIPSVEDTTFISKKIIFPIKKENTFKIRGQTVVIPLIKYKKYTKINDFAVKVSKPIKPSSSVGFGRDAILRYYSVTFEDGVYSLNFSKVKMNIFRLFHDRCKGNIMKEDCCNFDKYPHLIDSYNAYVNDKNPEELSRTIIDRIGQITPSDVVEATVMISNNDFSDGIRFDNITALTIAFYKMVNNEFSKIVPSYVRGTINTIRKSADIQNKSKTVNIKHNIFLTALSSDNSSFCDYLSVTNSFTTSACLTFKDFSTRERTFLLEHNMYEDPMGASVDSGSSTPSGGVVLYLDKHLLEV